MISQFLPHVVVNTPQIVICQAIANKDDGSSAKQEVFQFSNQAFPMLLRLSIIILSNNEAHIGAITVLNTAMAVPTVVVGLIGYSLLSRSAPLGFLDLMFSPKAVILGEFFLSFPVVRQTSTIGFNDGNEGDPSPWLIWKPT